MSGTRSSKVIEVLVTTALVLVAIRLVRDLFSGMYWDLPLAIVPVLFMWAPVWVLRARGDDPDRYPLAVPMLSERAVWGTAFRSFGVLVLLIGPLFVLGYHLWHMVIFPDALERLCDEGVRSACRLQRGVSDGPAWRVPSELPKLVAYHLFFVAVPEELFYRGYVQSRLDEVWPARWQVFGALVGPGLLISSLIFALGHSVVLAQWWHPAIFFPSLVFGWLRARTGGVMAGAFFHAASNIGVNVLDTVYGLAPV